MVATVGASEFVVNYEYTGAKWSELTTQEKAKSVGVSFGKICVIVASLYFFICSLSFLADGFRLVGGRDAGKVFSNSIIFDNPIAGMLVGVLVTVLVQSSSTSTSIIITMVAADLFSVKQAIYLVMGANIGTSVTSTIVALGQVGDRDEYKRAFAAATVHDMFNFLTVLILLPIEAATGYLFHFSYALLPENLKSGEKPGDILKVLTKPFTKMCVSIDKKLITKYALANTPEDFAELEGKPMLKHLMGNTTMDDTLAGVIVLVCALTILCITLALIIGTLRSLLKGRITVWIHRFVNASVPDIGSLKMGWVSGYLAMGFGLVLTILVQSSSITTSTLTPLVGVGVLNLERMYPMVLGANIGTCLTGVLAALAADSAKLYLTLQVAFCHLLFNITGIFLFYVIWPMRRIPLSAAMFLGRTTGKYRWFALAYLGVCFFIVPAIVFGISLGSAAATIVIYVIVVLAAIAIAAINMMQIYKPEKLPPVLRNWDFLPIWMRSLEPIDRVSCSKLTCCTIFLPEDEPATEVTKTTGVNVAVETSAA